MSRRTTIATLALAQLAGPALAEPTAITIRAISHDGKFIGDSMGGVRVRLTEAASGRELAAGTTSGTTGDTRKLVVEPRQRQTPIHTPDASAFRAVVDIDRPTLVRVEATGPLGKPDAQITVSAMRWLLPGQPLDGDGWTLEFPGLAVEPNWTLQAGGVDLVAKVTLMCGCPIEPGGHWDAAQYRVQASLYDRDTLLQATDLAYAGKPSTFAGQLRRPPPGAYRLLLTAHNATTGNVGVSERTVAIAP